MRWPTASVRLAHFSDVHLTTRPLGWALHDLRTQKADRLVPPAGTGPRPAIPAGPRRRPGAGRRIPRTAAGPLVFSGDATALGFAAETAHAARWLHVGDRGLAAGPRRCRGITIITRGRRSGPRRSSVSSPRGRPASGSMPSVYPFAQRVGPIWLVAVNSCDAERAAVGRERGGRVGPARSAAGTAQAAIAGAAGAGDALSGLPRRRPAGNALARPARLGSDGAGRGRRRRRPLAARPSASCLFRGATAASAVPGRLCRQCDADWDRAATANMTIAEGR